MDLCFCLNLEQDNFQIACPQSVDGEGSAREEEWNVTV